MESEEDIAKIREMMEFLIKREISKEVDGLSSSEKKIYDLTGEVGQTAMVSSLKVSSKTVSKVWKKLEAMGILVKVGKEYRKVI